MLVLPAPDSPEVSIVIVTARRPERLLRCLEAVVAGAQGVPSYEAVIVLNAAEPGMEHRLDESVEGARLEVSEVPLGLAGGVNRGMRRARGRLLHLLHDDTEVAPGWLAALVAALDRHPEAGAAGSLVLELDGGSMQSAGHVIWRDGTTVSRWPAAPPDPGSFRDPYPADYCASASLLVRREAYEAAGGFDEAFHPAYYVDADFAMALRAHGYVTVCAPASRVRHQRGGSSGAAFATFVSMRNRERFVAKWAADLEHQAPPGTGAADLERAHRATERRAAAVAAAGRRPAMAARAGGADEETELARLRRERALLLRDVEVKDAFIAEAQRLLTEATATRERHEAEGLRAQRALREGHEAAVELHRVHAALVRAHEQQAAAHDALAARYAAAEAELSVLRARAATLDAVEAGGWWRLRSRLLSLLALGRRARDAVRRSG